LIKIEDGQVFICKEDITPDDIDFKETGETWTGRNISNARNFNKDNGIEWKKGDIIFVSVHGDVGYEGYSGYAETTTTHNKRESYLAHWLDKISEWKHHFLTIAVKTGLVEIVPVSETNLEDEDIKIKSERIDRVIRRNKILYFRDEIEVTEFEEIFNSNKFSGKYSVKGVDIETRKRVDEFIIRDIIKEKFILEDGTEINGDRFDETQQQYNNW
jgi:hypothetical protein